MNKAVWSLIVIPLLLSGCKPNTPTKPQTEAVTKPVTQVDPATAGSIAGIVSFDGHAPAPQPIDMSQDPACTIDSKTRLTSESYVVEHGHLANVFVYIKDGLGDKNFAVPAQPLVIDQKGCRYVPHVAGAMVGQKVLFKNSDLAIHNVHTGSHQNPAWNESQQPGEPELVKSFETPELLIPIKCNQHPWMKMYLNVVNNPFFAVTGADGSFEIRGLPPGEYTLAAIHEKLGEKDIRIKVGPKQQQKAEFTFQQGDLQTAEAR
jgi:plastocyanin